MCTGGDTCSAPFDVTMTADIPADTCLDVDNVTPTCGSAGGRDVIIRAPSPVGGSAYFLTVPTGWIIQQLNPDCSVPGFSCGAGAYSVAGATGNPFWFFAVERADGGCGRVNIHVSRTM